MVKVFSNRFLSISIYVHIFLDFIVKFRINWALSNSLNTYNRHSDWHKLEVCATNVSIYF